MNQVNYGGCGMYTVPNYVSTYNLKLVHDSEMSVMASVGICASQHYTLLVCNEVQLLAANRNDRMHLMYSKLSNLQNLIQFKEMNFVTSADVLSGRVLATTVDEYLECRNTYARAQVEFLELIRRECNNCG